MLLICCCCCWQSCCPNANNRRGLKENMWKYKEHVVSPLGPFHLGIYLTRAIVEIDSPQIDARVPPRGRAAETSVAEPAAIVRLEGTTEFPDDVASFGVDINGSRFLGSSTHTRRFLTFSLHISSQNQALSDNAISSGMGMSPWHCW